MVETEARRFELSWNHNEHVQVQSINTDCSTTDGTLHLDLLEENCIETMGGNHLRAESGLYVL